MKDRELALWAVVVNWNGGAANRACLRSLVDAGLPAGRIVFVDNASTDGSPGEVRAAFPEAQVLANAANEGYGHATNRGVRHALERGATAVFLVNNDVVLPPGEETLERLAEALAEPGVGVAGPRVVYAEAPDTLWAAGGRMTFRQNLTVLLGHRRPDGPEFRALRDVDYVPGCAMLVRREVFERVGLLDGDYFAYHEDVEFCMKAREAGFRVRLRGDVRVLHDAHHSTGGGYNAARKYMMGLNTVRFLRRHGTPLRWAGFLLFDVASLPFAWLWRAPRGEGGAVLAKAAGTLAGLRGRRVTAADLARFERG